MVDSIAYFLTCSIYDPWSDCIDADWVVILTTYSWCLTHNSL